MITIPKYDPIFNIDLDFDGKNDNAIIPKVNKLTLKAFTVEFWIKAAVGNAGTVFSYAIGTSYKQFNIENASSLQIWLSNTLWSANVPVADGNWHYIVLRWQSAGGTITLYKDGQALTGVLAPSASLITGGSMVFGQTQAAGGFNPTGAFKGKIFNYRVWNQARTVFFSNQDMNRTIPGNAQTIEWQETGYIASGNKLSFNAIAPVAENLIFALDSAGVVWSTADFGNTLTKPAVAPLPPAFTQLTAATDWQMGMTSANAVWTSRNNGIAWSQPNTGAIISQASILTGGTGLAVTPQGAVYTIANYGVAYTQVAGTTLKWVSLSGTVAFGVGFSDKRIYSSVNSGTTWTQMPATTWEPVQIEVFGTTIVALTSTGSLYFSTDNAATWKSLTTAYNIQFTTAQLLLNTLWAIDINYQLIFTEINTELVINLRFDEGYGDAAFDSSGNDNHSILGGSVPDGKPAWEVSTQLSPPGFVTHVSSLFVDHRQTRLSAPEAVGELSLVEDSGAADTRNQPSVGEGKKKKKS